MKGRFRKRVRLPDYVAEDRINWQEVLLRTVLGVGVVSVSAMAPNALKILKNFIPDNSRSHIFRAKRSTERLIKLGFLKKTVHDGEVFVEITEKGDRYLKNLYKIPIKQEWDGKWRIVVYDVPEGNRKSRNALRRKLQEIGFQLLQTSVWVFPYKAEGVIDLIKTNTQLAEEVIYLETSYIENEKKLKKMFSL